MPNIRRQIVGPLGDKTVFALPGDDVGIYIQASDGREATITKRQIIARFLQEIGLRAIRRLKFIAWLKNRIAEQLGAEQVSLAAMDPDFDDGDGTPTRFAVRGDAAE